MLNCLMSAILQQVVVIGNLHDTKYIEGDSQNTQSNSIAHYHSISMAIMNFFGWHWWVG